MDTTVAGYIAVITFLLFTGVGSSSQVLKLYRRTSEWKLGQLDQSHVCDGLHPVRELYSFLAYFLFALSGLTRNYVDTFLLYSRLPVVLLSVIILWYLNFHSIKNAKIYFRFAVVLTVILLLRLVLPSTGGNIAFYAVRWLVDGSLSVVSLLVFYSKLLQASNMYRNKATKAVSWIREAGVIAKDITGLVYSLSIGSELMWISITHVLSTISSGIICAVKYRSEKSLPKSN